MQNDSNLLQDIYWDARHHLWMCTSETCNNPAGDYSGLPFPGNPVLVYFLNQITFVWLVRTWFRKRAEQHGKSNCRMSAPKHSQLIKQKQGRTRASIINRFQLATSKRGRPRAIRILDAFLIYNIIGRICLLATCHGILTYDRTRIRTRLVSHLRVSCCI